MGGWRESEWPLSLCGKRRDGRGAGKGVTAGEREKARRPGSGKRRDGRGAGKGATAGERETARRARETARQLGRGKRRDGWGAGKVATAGEREKARRLGREKTVRRLGSGKMHIHLLLLDGE